MKKLFIFLFITTLAVAQDFERVKPKEPTEFKDEEGTIYAPSKGPRRIIDGETVLLPNLKGVILTGKETFLSSKELEHSIGGTEAINIAVPGSLGHLNAMITEKFLNRPLTRQGMIDLKYEILLYYRRWGRPIVTIEIPQQKITGGILQIVVVEGKLGKVTVEGNQYFQSESFHDSIRLQKGEPIDSNILITDLDWINRNPFRQVDAIYTPGEIAGTTDIRLLAVDRRPYRFYAGADNTGFDETNNTRLFVGTNWGNVFDLGHILSVQATAAPNIDRFWSLTGHYTVPLPWRDVWTFYGGYSHVHGDLNRPGCRNSGYAAQASTRYNWILPPRLAYLSDLIFGFDFKRTDNNIEFGGERVYRQSVNLTQLVFGYNGGYGNGPLKASFSFELLWSPGGWLPQQSDSDYSNVRFGAKSSYIYGRFTLAPILVLPNKFSASLTLRGQLSSQNLLPSEQAGLGGYDTVRGYKEREVNVDNAFLASMELRSPSYTLLRKKDFNNLIQLLLFLDYAVGRDVRTKMGAPKSHYLLGAGPGVRYDIASYLAFRGDFGFQLKKLDSRGFRFHFSLIASY